MSTPADERAALFHKWAPTVLYGTELSVLTLDMRIHRGYRKASYNVCYTYALMNMFGAGIG